MLTYDLLKNLIPVSCCLKKRDNGDFLIVLNEDGELFYLNDTAKYVYDLFDSKSTVNDILQLMKNNTIRLLYLNLLAMHYNHILF